jgi:hypothetical protein
MRRISLIIIFMLLCLSASPAWASESRQGVDCIVADEEVVEGNLYALCRTVVIDGVVNGDLWAAALNITVNGEVTGSVYVAGGKLLVNGIVGATIHFGGGIVAAEEAAALTNDRANFYAAALSSELNTPLSGNAAGIGYQMLINAPVAGNVDFAGTALVINATVSGSVNASTGDPQRTGVNELESLIQLVESDANLIAPGLVVTENGAINGTLIYRAPTEGDIQGDVDTIQFTRILPDSAAIINQQDVSSGISAYLQQVAREFVIIVVIGAIALFFVPRNTLAPLPAVRNRTISSVGVGLLAFILSFPIAIIAVVFSVLIVVLLSLLNIDQLTLLAFLVLGVINVALIGAFYFTALFISRVFVGLVVGRFLVRLLWRGTGKARDNYVYLLVGALVLALLTAVPFVGSIVLAISAFLGLGALIYALQAPATRLRPTMNAAITRNEPPRLPPPPVDDAPPALGADRLPDGFNWWQ